MKRKLIYLQVISLLATATWLSSCGDDAPAKPVLPTVTTTAISNITTSGAKTGGNVTNDGGSAVTARGVCWSTTESPIITGDKTSNGTGKGEFESLIESLPPNVKYYVRAYATNKVGTAYGDQLSFTTGIALPTLTTTAATEITSNSAKSGGEITDDGGSAITARGVCWGTSENPTIDGAKTSNGTGKGEFQSTIENLSPNVKYYVRAYATNMAGTVYGDQLSFTTSVALPTLTTTIVTEVTSNSAKSGGNITSDGGSAITARGVCWSTSENPDLSQNHTSDGSGTGVFESAIANLGFGSTYYVRSYATNSAGTSYGNQVTFHVLAFSEFTKAIIENQDLKDDPIEGVNEAGTELLSGKTILYKTKSGRYGKMQVIGIDPLQSYKLIVYAITYDTDGTVYSENQFLEIRGTWPCDLDALTETVGDFTWLRPGPGERAVLFPVNGAKFHVY